MNMPLTFFFEPKCLPLFQRANQPPTLSRREGFHRLNAFSPCVFLFAPFQPNWIKHHISRLALSHSLALSHQNVSLLNQSTLLYEKLNITPPPCFFFRSIPLPSLQILRTRRTCATTPSVWKPSTFRMPSTTKNGPTPFFFRRARPTLSVSGTSSPSFRRGGWGKMSGLSCRRY